MIKKKGIFISFEGPECSGKSSQLLQLNKFLKLKKIPFLITREPGGTDLAEKLRKIILDKKSSISVIEEILLLFTARNDHINTVIKPALKNGYLVISDRFADSTFVYQGFVNNYGLKKTFDLHKLLLDNFLPKKTFLFLLNHKEIINRLKKRKYFNKFDNKNIFFHKKVIQGYKKISKNNNRFIIINADNPFDKVKQDIQNNILKIIKYE